MSWCRMGLDNGWNYYHITGNFFAIKFYCMFHKIESFISLINTVSSDSSDITSNIGYRKSLQFTNKLSFCIVISVGILQVRRDYRITPE